MGRPRGVEAWYAGDSGPTPFAGIRMCVSRPPWHNNNTRRTAPRPTADTRTALMRPASVPVLALAVALCLTPTGPTTGAADPAPDPQQIEFFEKKIRPVLTEHCYACHSADAERSKKLKGGLLLDTRDGLLRGGDSGPAIVPGKAAERLL